MFLALMVLTGFLQFQPAPVMAIHPPVDTQPDVIAANIGGNFYNSWAINPRSPVSASVLVANAVRAGRLRVGHVARYPVYPNALKCSPVPCVVPNVDASEGGGNPVNETPIAANPLRQWHMLSGGNDYNCPNTQGFFATKNGGTTWNHTCFNNLAGSSGVGDPAVGYDTNNNLFAMGIDQFSGTTTNVAFEKSSNDGVTWSAPAVAIVGIGAFTFVDKEWMQIDDGATSPGKNNIYASQTDFDPSSNSLISVVHSYDGGATWKNVQVDSATFPVVDQFSDLAIGSDGTVYVTWMRCSATGSSGNCGGTKAAILFSKSTDAGAHWTKPVIMAPANLAPDTCGAFYGCLPNTGERVSDIPAIDVDRSSGPLKGRLYVAYYNFTGNKMQVLVIRSKTGGATWSAPVAVDASVAQDQFMPWLTTNSSGVVGVTWLDRRNDSANVNYDAFSTISGNGAISFAPNVRLSSVASNPNNDGFGGAFMGDYTGNIWSGVTLFASWTDTRSGVAQDEIGGFRR